MTTGVRWGAAGLVLGVGVALLMPSLAQSPSPTGEAGRTVTVNGTAIVRSAPDEAVLYLGVQTHAEGANAALQANADKMAEVIAAVRGAGVSAGDISTSSFNLNPEYDYEGNKVTGYMAVNQLTVTVRNMSDVGTVIDDAVGAGANIASGVSFQLSDANEGVNDALALAVNDARSKAEALAAATGASLGQVVSVQEMSSSGIPPIYYDRAEEAGAPTPIIPSTVETQVTVTVVWSLA